MRETLLERGVRDGYGKRYWTLRYPDECLRIVATADDYSGRVYWSVLVKTTENSGHAGYIGWDISRNDVRELFIQYGFLRVD